MGQHEEPAEGWDSSGRSPSGSAGPDSSSTCDSGLPTSSQEAGAELRERHEQGAELTQVWGVFIGEDWQCDANTASTGAASIKVVLPGGWHGLQLMKELHRRYPPFNECYIEAFDLGIWTLLGCLDTEELDKESEKVLRMRPPTAVGHAHEPRYVVVYSGRKAPRSFPAEPELVLPLPSTCRTSAVLELLHRAKPHHCFRLQCSSSEGPGEEWQELELMMEVPPGSLHVWAAPTAGNELEVPEEEVLLQDAPEGIHQRKVWGRASMTYRKRHEDSSGRGTYG